MFENRSYKGDIHKLLRQQALQIFTNCQDSIFFFYDCLPSNKLSYFSTKTYVVGAAMREFF